MSDSPTTVALVGLGGYGEVYVRALLDGAGGRPVSLVAGVDPVVDRGPRLRERGVRVFASLAQLYDAGLSPDLVILSSPLHLHAEQSELALSAGSHVLCEKPVAATPDEAASMIAARDRSGRTLAIGYQWAFDPGMQRLKADVRRGRFGRPRRFACRTFWPRLESYYARNRWAGRVRSPEGRIVLDSPLNNACAHHAHFMLHLLGAAPDTADWPADVMAELYRAHAIENYDTVVVRCRTASTGVEMLAAFSHVTAATAEPTFTLEFDDATITSGPATNDRIVAHLPGHAPIDYGRQPPGDDVAKVWQTVAAIRAGTPVACSVESAAAHTALMYAAQQSGGPPVDFPADHVVATGASPDRSVVVRGLESVLDRCVAEFRLPSELGVHWARPAKPVRAEGLHRSIADARGAA